MARRYQRNALADEDGHDVDVELVQFADIEKGRDQLSAAHHPDVFPRRCSETSRKFFDGFGDEFDTWRRLLRRLAREDVVGEPGIEYSAFATRLPVIVEGPVVGLASPQDGIDGGVEGAHTVIDGVGTAV